MPEKTELMSLHVFGSFMHEWLGEIGRQEMSLWRKVDDWRRDCQNILSGAEVLIGGQRSKPKREVFLTIESFVNIILRNLLAESKIRDNIP